MKKKPLLDLLHELKRRFPKAAGAGSPGETIDRVIAAFKQDLAHEQAAGSARAKAWMDPHYWVKFEPEGDRIVVFNDENQDFGMFALIESPRRPRGEK